MTGNSPAVMTLNPSNSRDLKICREAPEGVAIETPIMLSETPIISSSPRRRVSSLLIPLGSCLRGNDNLDLPRLPNYGEFAIIKKSGCSTPKRIAK